MNTIYSALTSNSTTQGIKGIDIFYDTSFINVKASSTYGTKEYLLIDKLTFDYSTNVIDSETSNIILFGDTGSTCPRSGNGNGLIDNILIEHDKKVLICGLSAFHMAPLTAYSGANIISGATFVPVVYEYNLNNSKLIMLYPDETIASWKTIVMGNYLSGEKPTVNFDYNTNELSFLIKTSLSSNNTIGLIDTINDIRFNYDNGLSFTEFRQLTALRVGNCFIDHKFMKSISYNSGDKVIVSNNNSSLQLFRLL